MDLKGEIVKHTKFGIGTIVESKSDYIIVLFHEANERKKFLYPDVIGEFLELQQKPSLGNDMRKETETEQENEHERKRIKEMKGAIKREKGIKKIIGLRRQEDKNK